MSVSSSNNNVPVVYVIEAAMTNSTDWRPYLSPQGDVFVFATRTKAAKALRELRNKLSKEFSQVIKLRMNQYEQAETVTIHAPKESEHGAVSRANDN